MGLSRRARCGYWPAGTSSRSRNPEETGYERIVMSQISSSSRNGAVLGPILMLLASLALAGSNLPQSLLPTPPQYGGYGMASTGMAFWQYLIATVIALPLIMRIGIKN